MYWSALWRQRARGAQAKPADVPQKVACTYERRCTGLLDLPENLIINILRYLPTGSKCQAELVCRSFREILNNPTAVDFVWDVINLRDLVFEKVSLDALNR